jgi:hypothetical protein
VPCVPCADDVIKSRCAYHVCLLVCLSVLLSLFLLLLLIVSIHVASALSRSR